ncbi:hypothetical protein [Cellulophaga sp. Ld12]|uniref:hypothetical protein n=1 Tax=Cellulophaga sp. Ld12 TaxID=3229535 RepID=UPI003869BF3D
MSIIVKSVKLFSNEQYTPGEEIKVGEYNIDGKKHKLFTIPLGSTAKFQPILYNNRIQLNNHELRDHLKWILCHINPKNGTKSYKSWEGDKPPAFSYDEKEKLEDYADTQIVSLRFTDSKEIGAYYWLESFMQYPEFPEANTPKGVYVTFEDSPFVKESCFTSKGYCNFSSKDLTEKPLLRYGDTVNLFLETYKIPNPLEDKHNYVNFKVVIFSAETKKAVSGELSFLGRDYTDYTTFLTTVKLPILIDLNWKSKVKHINDKDEIFYAEITPILKFIPDVDFKESMEEIIEEGNKRNKQLSTQINLKAVDALQIKKGNDYSKELLRMNSRTLRKYKTTHFFKVSYQTTSDIIIERQNKVGQQLVSFKDINHNCLPNFNPCKYTEISINEPDRNTDVIIFQEIGDGTISDNTNKPFEIVAGDKTKKKITITLCDLEHGGTPVECMSIGGAHESANDVWRINQSLARTQWLRNEDIVIKENKLELSLRYVYNKSFENYILDYLSLSTNYIVGNINKLKNIWVVRYLYMLVMGERIDQSYFIPISTCRYPNQNVIINVYPDMKWVFNLAYNITEPLYYNETKTNMGDGNFDEDITGRIKNKRDSADAKHIATAYQNQKSNFRFYVSCEVNGTKLDDLGKTFSEKYRKMFAPFTALVNKLDTDLGLSSAKAETEILGKSGKKGLLARLNKLPMSFELIAPQLGVGVGIGYGESSGSLIGYELEGRIIANPIIGANVVLDVLALGSKVKPWGAIIDALDIADFLLNFCSGGKIDLEYKIEVKFTAEIILCGSKSEDGLNTPANIRYNFEDKSFKAPDIALQGRIKGEITFEFGIKLKAVVQKAQAIVTDDNEEKMKDVAGLGMSGGASSEMSLTFGKDFGKNGKFATDFYFSGVTVYIKFYAGRKKEKDDELIKQIIPDYKETINIFKKTGEVK